jgi:hypothetical protein
MNIVFLRIPWTSVGSWTKHMNLAVRATQKSNQAVFKLVLSLGADRIDQAVLSVQQTVRVACPLGTIAVSSDATNVRTGKVGLQERSSVSVER